jgi:hypothetical protein
MEGRSRHLGEGRMAVTQLEARGAESITALLWQCHGTECGGGDRPSRPVCRYKHVCMCVCVCMHVCMLAEA